MQSEVDPICRAERLRHRADTIFLLVMGGRVIAMQTGFAMLEAAYGRPMNSANIMMKNSMDLFIGAIAFYFFGYTIAFGDQPLLIEENAFDFALWFLHFSYATTAATIDSGALAGRVSFVAYLVLSAAVTGVVYPLVVQWAWGGGWLQELGYTDFAGSSIVHMVGAISALVSVCICGPRIGRFPEYRAWKGPLRWLFAERNPSEFYRMPKLEVEKAVYSPIKACSNPVQLLFGTFLLLVGFLAFNPASTLSTTSNADLVSARTTVVTLLSASSGAMACVAASIVTTRSMVMTVPDLINAVLGGLVASCAGCNVIPPLLSMFVGFVGGLLALAVPPCLERLQIDDAVGAVAVHGPPGAWGVLCVPLFARPNCQSELAGLVFGGGEAALRLLGVQALGLVSLGSFAAASTYLIVLGIDLFGGFRCSRATELIGLDFIEHRIDNGNLKFESDKSEIETHSPIRDCLMHRVKMTVSPTKAYAEGEKKTAETGGAADGTHVAGNGGGGGEESAPATAVAVQQRSTGRASTHTVSDAFGVKEAPADVPDGMDGVVPVLSGGKAAGAAAGASAEELAGEVDALKATVADLSRQLSMVMSGLRATDSGGAWVLGGGHAEGANRETAHQMLLNEANMPLENTRL